MSIEYCEGCNMQNCRCPVTDDEHGACLRSYANGDEYQRSVEWAADRIAELERQNAELRAGKARVFTYENQPGNVEAWRFGEACSNTLKKPGGDYIDTGLQLLLELQNKGYGVAALAQDKEPK